MELEVKSMTGNVTIDTIITVAGKAASECYGVIGMASKDSTFQGLLSELLKKENYNQGIFAKTTKNGYELDIYIIVAFGVRLTEVVSEVQKRVKYVLEKTLHVKLKTINVYVQGIKNL